MEELQVQAVSESAPETRNRVGMLRFILDILETLLLAVVLFVAINVITARIRVDGDSMEPTLHNGQFVVVNKVAYKIDEPQRGEVIVFHYPRDPQQEYIKRVIGLPGDKIDIYDGQVYVNGELIQEPYIAASPTYPGTWIVPHQHLFVLGDNRNNSSDSHKWGTVPFDYVVGKAVLIYWPPPTWGMIRHTASAAP